MTAELIKKVAQQLGAWMDPKPFLRAVSEAVENRLGSELEDASPLEKVLRGSSAEGARRLDRTVIQSACSVRNVRQARLLAELLIDERGQIDLELLQQALFLLRRYTHRSGEGLENDGVRQQHLLNCISRLVKDEDLREALERIAAPHHLSPAERVIRETLLLDADRVVTDAHARRAALSAWLTYLRQNVGSCFATAPAILVQLEQPLLFFQDIESLFTSGRLSRVVAGKTLTAPFAASWGIGDLRRQVRLDRSPEKCPVPVWESPGLQNALLAAGVLSESAGLETQLHAQLFTYLEGLPEEALPGVFAIDELLAVLVRRHLALTDEDVRAQEDALPALIVGGLVVPTTSQGQRDRETRVEEYHQSLERAKNSFRASTDNALLKAWEFSVASFAETKVQFARWNLYASLGFDYREAGGVGERLYELLQERLTDLNGQIQMYNEQLETVHAQVEFTGARLKRASTEQEVRFLQAEYQSRSGEFRHIQSLQQIAERKAQIMSQLHTGLLNELDDEFQDFFQEVYDPDMHEIATGPYDDAPAGFRLLCKYGRSSTSQWSMIHSPSEFADALAAFFVHAEHVLLNREDLEPVRDELAPIITGLVGHVKTPQFLESAFHRMGKAHGGRVVEKPLENLDKLDKKPWSYTSGGDMSALVANYFGRERKPSQRARWVESPSELLVFLIDCVRELPARTQDLFERHSERRLLMHSPTHAFTLIPGQSPFCDAWRDNDRYTYTWVRDTWVRPAKDFLGHLRLEGEAVESLLTLLKQEIPPHYHLAFEETFRVTPSRITPPEFRDYVKRSMEREPQLRWGPHPVISPAEVDALLYSELPYTSGNALKRNLERLFAVLPDQTEAGVERLMRCYEEYRDFLRKPNVISARGLREIALGVVLSAQGSASGTHDWHRELFLAASRVGLAMPLPIVFADSNWVTDHFAFVVNPGTLELDFWRVNTVGSEGAPMSIWREWLDGSRRDREWAVFTQPQDYTYVPPQRGSFLRV